MKACADCRFHDDGWGNNCDHPEGRKDDPVYGYNMISCHAARADDGPCGPDARLFEKRRSLIWRVASALIGHPVSGISSMGAAEELARASVQEVKTAGNAPIETYRDFLIDFDPPPIGSRALDWCATHKDYDGPEDGRHFRAASIKDLYVEIDDYLDCSEASKAWLVRPYESDCEWQITTEQPDDETRRWFEIKPYEPQGSVAAGPPISPYPLVEE